MARVMSRLRKQALQVTWWRISLRTTFQSLADFSVVIRNCKGKVIRNYYGPVNSMNANAAEVYAMLIGCHELLSLGGYNAIIEGDSYSAIQWGSGKASHPWTLTDLVEEVKDIDKQLGASFHHIHREANVMADALAKEGVLCSSILFDV
ncbi:hypothetical protein AAC387_Pa01g2800 [Persea americana]